MAKLRLTKKLVESAPDGVDGLPEAWVQFDIWDTEAKGLGLRVSQSGLKKWTFKYTFAGQPRRLTMGTYPAMTLDQARSKAHGYRSALDAGQDPELKPVKAEVMTVNKFMDKFHEEYVELKPKENTRDNYAQATKHIKKHLGELLLSSLSFDDVYRMHRAMKGTPRMANIVVCVASVAMKYAEKCKLRPRGSNPTLGLEKYPENKRDRYLTKDELAALGRVLNASYQDRIINHYALGAIKLLLFTGMRKQEVLDLQWAQVHLDEMRIRVDEHKGDKHGVKWVPLNPQAHALLKGLKRINGNPYVFVGRRGMERMTNLQKTWVAIRRRMKAEGFDISDVTIHDLRHTFASYGVSVGLALPQIGGVLGHRNQNSTQRYAHVDMDPKREAAEKIGSEIERLLG